jgi:hypothetical protein
MAELQISVAFDIMDNRPHKAVRLYTSTGMALGYGEVQINKVPESGDLFEKVPGAVIYLVDMNMETLATIFNKAINGNSANKTKEEIKSDIDVPDTDDPAEDEWVRKSLYQLKEVKSKIDIFTVENLRKDYKEMMLKKKANENKPPEPPQPEIVFAETYEIKHTIDKDEDDYVRNNLPAKFKLAEALGIINKLREDYRRDMLKRAMPKPETIALTIPADDPEQSKVFDLDKVWDFSEEKKEEPKPKTQSLDDLLRNL